MLFDEKHAFKRPPENLAMPRLNGLEATQQLLKAVPAVKVIMLSSHNDDARLVSAINSGVAGFLFKQTSARFMCQAIREVCKGKTIFSPEIARRLGRLPAPLSDRAGKRKLPITQLTARQREVLQLVAEGKANKEMAAELGLDIKTIEKHREGLMRKLDMHDTAGLTRYAIDAGIIESSVPLTVK